MSNINPPTTVSRRRKSGFLAERFTTLTNLLVLEKSLDNSGQEWIENVNIIEQLLVRITDRLGQERPALKCKFILRRLPTYLAPFVNKNEYGIVIQDVHFTFTPTPSSRPGTSASGDHHNRPGTTNFGQVEIFHCAPPEGSKDRNGFKEHDLSHEVLNEKQAYCSHEVFKRFTSAFVDAYQTECDIASAANDASAFHYSGDVQLLGPHLLEDLQNLPEVDKIFTINQPPLPPPRNLKSKSSVNVNYLKSTITVQYDETEVVVRPCFYKDKGFARANANLLERLPLHHPMYLQIGKSLQKGFLLFPTSFETLWTLQFWPSESHIISSYHSASVTSRVFKLYSAFCLNPIHLWESINSSFLVGAEDSLITPSLLEDSRGMHLLNLDYLMSSFLFELECFSHMEDWAPRNFPTRFTHLMKTAVDSFEKGFHSHYFTRINVLRGIWKQSHDGDEQSALRELDDVTCESLDDYGEHAILSMNDLDDDFGFQFDDLETIDDEAAPPPQSRPRSAVSPRMRSRVQPEVIEAAAPTISRRSTPTPFSSLFRAVGKKLSRRHTTHTDPKPRGSITDIASSFEESVAHMRRPDSVRLRLKYQTASDLRAETCFSATTTTAYQNEGYQPHVETIYSALLQTIMELPPSDYISDHASLAELARAKKVLESQEELISIWGRACSEFPRPKCICPHVFNPRQVHYLSKIIHLVSLTSPNMIQIVKTLKQVPVWEISGDILRTVLHQMRVEVAESETLKEKQRPQRDPIGPKRSHRKLSMKFSLRRRSSSLECQHSFVRPFHGESDAQFALEEPEKAATTRLLEWLWNLRISEIGRLSAKASQYMEHLYETSLVNSYFLEQLKDDKVFAKMAFKSATAVTRIMSDLSLPVSVPLCAATSKGWLWAEMVLSLASWNNEKGYTMKAQIPLEDGGDDEFLERVLLTDDAATESLGTLKQKQVWEETVEPDLEAATLAFHSELATPIGWNDFEDPRRPGPYAAAILILSSADYYRKWEVAPGNIVQVLVRLQKFNSMQLLGQWLNPPHRKTVLNEIRKLNKSLSLRIYNFDDTVMSKTFKRLNSVRATRSRMTRREASSGLSPLPRNKYTCADAGCNNDHLAKTIVSVFKDVELECTKL